MSITALTIGANALKAISIRHGKARSRESALPPGSVRNGLILQPEVLGKEIKSLLKAGRFPASSVVCAVNGLPFSYRMLNIPKIEASSFREAVVRTAKKEMSISPDDMYLSWQAYPADDDEWQVLVTGITRHPIDNLIKALSAAGVAPWLMDLPHLALARLSPYRDAVIVDLEKDCSNIVLIADGIPRGMHMVPALAAEATLQDQVSQVADKLAKMIEFYNGSRPVKPVKEPARTLFTGELFDEEDAVRYFETQIGYPVEPLEAAGRSFSTLSLRRYAVNAGLLDIRTDEYTGKGPAPYYYLDLEDVIKARRPKTDIVKAVKKLLVPAGIAGGLALLVVSYLSAAEIRENITALNADLGRVNSELAQKQGAAGRAVQIENNINEINSRIEAIESGRQQIFSSREYVDDISAVVASMPDGVTFDSLDITLEGIMLEGSAREAAAVIEFAGNLEAVGGFSQALIEWIDAPHDIGGAQQAHYFRISIAKNASYTG